MIYKKQTETWLNSARPPCLTLAGPDDAFELFYKIESVVVIVREPKGLHAIEHNHAGRLMRELDRFGREGVRIVGLLANHGAATTSSLRALNCYLRHGPGLDNFRRAPKLYRCRNPFHRFGWNELKRHVGIVFN
jgi:hypothetical protein